MMPYYPVCLDLRGRPCVVVGGGKVAERKVNGLLACNAQVKIISPDLTEELMQLHTDGKLEWLDRPYRRGDLAQAFLVIAATDDEQAQQMVQEEAEEQNKLLNVADVPQRCNFILPATVRRGDLTIAVATGGKGPALAKKLRQELEKRVGPEYTVLVNILGALRPQILASGLSQPENELLFHHLLHDEMAEWIKNREWDSLKKHLRAVLGDRVDGDRLSEILTSIDGK
jgi:precorrin-2 dehydrogenase/sirohydrochlorin ferrochelatase